MNRPVVALLALVVLCACGGSRPETPVPPTWAVDVAPSLTIDWDPETPGHDLYDIKAAIRLDDGRLAVVDGGSAEVRYFDAYGRYLGFAGGDGKGPGAFRRIEHATRGNGDTIVIRTMDPAIVRVDAATGSLGAAVPLDPGTPSSAWHTYALLTGLGTVVFQPYPSRDRSRPPAAPEGRYRENLPLIHLDPAADAVDTVGIFPTRESSRTGRAAFPASLVLAQAAGRLFIGDTGSDSILVVDEAGARQAWHIALEREEVPQAVVMAAAKSRWKVDLPSHLPRFNRMLADRSGNLWVQAFPEASILSTPWYYDDRYYTGGDWLVLSPTGKEIARVRMPAGLRVLEIGEDYVLGTVREDINVDVVRLYALRKFG